MRSMLSWVIGAASLALAAACGGNVVVDPGAGGAGSGGGGGSGPGPQVCGGKQGLQCPTGQWCKWDPPGSCGSSDGTGTCQPAPTACTADCPGVCGCDGLFYCNACGAEAAGTDVSSAFNCGPIEDGGPPPAEYAAYVLATNLPRYAIAKTELAENRCTWVIVSLGPGVGFPIQTTMGWSVETLFVTDAASDCKGPPGGFPMPSGQGAKPSDATGSVKQDQTMNPCFVSVHLTLTFEPAAPWVPPQEALDADMLPIQGACGP
jgi:hypothetical protein